MIIIRNGVRYDTDSDEVFDLPSSPDAQPGVEDYELRKTPDGHYYLSRTVCQFFRSGKWYTDDIGKPPRKTPRVDNGPAVGRAARQPLRQGVPVAHDPSRAGLGDRAANGDLVFGAVDRLPAELAELGRADAGEQAERQRIDASRPVRNCPSRPTGTA